VAAVVLGVVVSHEMIVAAGDGVVERSMLANVDSSRP